MTAEPERTSRNIGVKVEYLTRVEGHGNIVVEVKDGAFAACRFDVVESPRFFEALLRGRSIFEAQHITSRICGICACAHSLTSIQAAEEALGVIPSAQTIALRRILLDWSSWTRTCCTSTCSRCRTSSAQRASCLWSPRTRRSCAAHCG